VGILGKISSFPRFSYGFSVDPQQLCVQKIYRQLAGVEKAIKLLYRPTAGKNCWQKKMPDRVSGLGCGTVSTNYCLKIIQGRSEQWIGGIIYS
jgi:hypothetical protein